jgi:hypothetical protein
LPHPESLFIVRPITASSSLLTRRRIGRQTGQFPQEPWPVYNRATEALETFRARLGTIVHHERTAYQTWGKDEPKCFKVMSMKAHWTIIYWCADHAHDSGFLDSLFTLEPTEREVRESLRACDAARFFRRLPKSELTWALDNACSAETEGKSSPVFYAKLLASTLLLDTRLQRKTVKDMQ